jgi:hypothetical protein
MRGNASRTWAELVNGYRRLGAKTFRPDERECCQPSISPRCGSRARRQSNVWRKQSAAWHRTHRSLAEEPVYFLRWELLTTARLYDTLPTDVWRNAPGRPRGAPVNGNQGEYLDGTTRVFNGDGWLQLFASVENIASTPLR